MLKNPTTLPERELPGNNTLFFIYADDVWLAVLGSLLRCAAKADLSSQLVGYTLWTFITHFAFHSQICGSWVLPRKGA